jgi:opacity protein-like surface antigen
MNDHLPQSSFRLRSALARVALTLCALGAAAIANSAPLDFYLGASYGQAHVRAELNGLSGSGGSLGPLGGFDATHSAYQAMLGMRLLSFVGAEVAYVDLGQSSLRGPGTPAPGLLVGSNVTAEQVSQKGAAAFAMLYLPVPIIDVYVKAGVSRMTTDMNATATLIGVATCPIGNPNCAVVYGSRSVTDVGFAYGAGVQWKLGQWAVRGEYERFDAAGANPSLLSIGMTFWLF